MDEGPRPWLSQPVAPLGRSWNWRHYPDPGAGAIRPILAWRHYADPPLAPYGRSLTPAAAAVPLTGPAYLQRLGVPVMECCPVCGRELIAVLLERHRAPPEGWPVARAVA